MHRPSSCLACFIAALTFSAHRPAQAEQTHAISPGLTLSVSFGEKPAFGIGLDVRYTTLLMGSSEQCGNSRAGVGFFAQATWLNFSAGRFAAGVHGGGEIEDTSTAADGEFGWTYRTAYDRDYPGGHGLHLGMSSMILPVLDLSVRSAIPWIDSPTSPEMTIGMGGRFPSPFGFTGACVIEGRPLRHHDHYVLPAVASRPSYTHTHLPASSTDPTTRQALARAFVNDARTECASIPAFIALARDLASIGAPAYLIRRALQAACDEANHTALCSALARRHAFNDVAIELLLPPNPSQEDRLTRLIRLAIESWQDGCLGEGAAAQRARLAQQQADDPAAKKALAIIARDEQTHADLARDIVTYCLAEGGKPVRQSLEQAILASPESMDIPTHGDIDAAAWQKHGRLSQGAVISTWETTRIAAQQKAKHDFRLQV